MGNQSIKQSVKNGVAKAPVIMQLEALECGAASLAMILAYYDKWVPLEQVREDCGVSRDGSKAKNVALAAMHYGLEVKAFRLNPKSIQEKATFPCIIHWNMNHFVVLNGFKRNHAYLNDPARGNVAVSMEEFDECFTGVTVILTYLPHLHGPTPHRNKPRLVRALYQHDGLAGSHTDYRGLGAGGVLAQDQRQDGSDRQHVLHVEGAPAAHELLLAAAGRRHPGAPCPQLHNCGHAGKHPRAAFAQYLHGVFYLFVMLRQNVPLTLIGITALVLNIAVSGFITKQRINITRVQMRDQAKLASTKAGGIDMIETIKSSGAENGFFQKWAGYQASVNTQTVKTNKTNLLVGRIPMLLTDVANYGILVLGVYLTMNGEYTMGGVLMFQGFLTSFMTPAQELITSGQTIQEMRTQMERVEDVMEYPDDEALGAHKSDTGDEAQAVEKLKGNLELKNVTFGYSKLEPPLIENFSLTLKPGERLPWWTRTSRSLKTR